MKTLATFTADVTATLTHNEERSTFTVTYGKHVAHYVLLSDAMADFWGCVHHSATCAYLVDSDQAFATL